MKKFAIVIFFAFISSVAAADCYGLLTQNYSRDSHAYQLMENAVSYEIERGTPEFAQAAVKALGHNVGCQVESANKAQKIEVTSVSCQDVVPDVRRSRVCYVESEYGYFLVSVDMLENINIVFNRWD